MIPQQKEKKKKILMLLLKDFAPDPRVLKEANYLARKGYDIEIIAWKYRGDYPQEEYKHFKVVHLGPALIQNFEKRNIFLKIISVLYSIIGFMAHAFFYALKKPCDIIHAHDLTALPLGVILKWFKRKTLIYDSHEDYPNLLRDMSILLWLPGLFLEKICSYFVNGIITINKEFAQKLERFGKPVVVAANYIDLTWFDTYKNHKKISFLKKKYGIKQDTIVAMYCGIIKEIRGVKEIVIASKLLPAALRDNVVFFIVGDGPYYQRLVAFAQDQNAKNVHIIGKIPYDEVPTYSALADIGLHVQYLTRNNEFCSPNKLFEYMAGACALIISNLPGMRSVVEHNQLGCTVTPGSAQEIADAITVLATDRKKLTAIGEKSRLLVEKTYNWDSQMKNVELLYKKLDA
ncbi:glycosyltransferase family 4 protein [Candidatus Woesearchaeota archaeon]|nr:glycosyltransferase family 4 protein [Candidatus Woesearchaeota archaeon]